MAESGRLGTLAMTSQVVGCVEGATIELRQALGEEGLRGHRTTMDHPRPTEHDRLVPVARAVRVMSTAAGRPRPGDRGIIAGR